jgi:hypothetical protein
MAPGTMLHQSARSYRRPPPSDPVTLEAGGRIQFGPKAITIVLLGLRPNWFLYDPDAPLPFQVWSLPENLALEAAREAIRCRNPKDTAAAASRAWPPRWLTTGISRAPVVGASAACAR